MKKRRVVDLNKRSYKLDSSGNLYFLDQDGHLSKHRDMVYKLQWKRFIAAHQKDETDFMDHFEYFSGIFYNVPVPFKIKK